MINEICLMTASDMVRRMRSKELSANEVMLAHLEQIDRINETVNAIVTLLPEKGIRDAKAADEAFTRGEELGVLHGLPIAHKDLLLTRGIRTTFGSLVFSDFVPEEDALIVSRLRQAGAIAIGKTNTPELGAGSQTYNEVFGETLNPYDTTKTCGGSSGGAAVALACRMLPLADGSDTGGSLRNPASFCNVVGFRTSPGRVPVFPSQIGWSPTSVQGPMARNVEDIALMLSAIAGPDLRVPISITEPGNIFLRPLERDFRDVTIAWSDDLGGLPVDHRVSDVIKRQMTTLENLGCRVEKADPTFENADELFKIWRGWAREATSGNLLKKHRAQIKDTLAWDIEQGVHLTGSDIGWAEKARTKLFLEMHQFMRKYEFLVCPVSQVPPFDVKQRWITEINDEKMETFIDWMKSSYYISATSHPSISIPCGFTPEGLPIGIQIVGRYRDDFGVLQLAKGFEAATGFSKRLPELAK